MTPPSEKVDDLCKNGWRFPETVDFSWKCILFVYTCCLGYINPEKALRVHVDDEDKGVNEMGTPGGTQKVTFVNESGFLGIQSEISKSFSYLKNPLLL